MSNDGLVVESRRGVPSKILTIVLTLVGVGLAVGGLWSMDSVETARTGLLFGMGGLLLMSSLIVCRVSAMHCVARLRLHVVSIVGRMFAINRTLSPFPHGAVVA